MEFILTRIFCIRSTGKVRQADAILSCVLTVFDMYTDINTVYSLLTYSGDNNNCTYNCPLLFAYICPYCHYINIHLPPSRQSADVATYSLLSIDRC